MEYPFSPQTLHEYPSLGHSLVLDSPFLATFDEDFVVSPSPLFAEAFSSAKETCLFLLKYLSLFFCSDYSFSRTVFCLGVCSNGFPSGLLSDPVGVDWDLYRWVLWEAICPLSPKPECRNRCSIAIASSHN